MINPVWRAKGASFSTAKPKQQSIAHCTASRCIIAKQKHPTKANSRKHADASRHDRSAHLHRSCNQQTLTRYYMSLALSASHIVPQFCNAVLQHGGLGAWQAPPCASFCAPAVVIGTTTIVATKIDTLCTSHACWIPITPSTLLSS